MNEQKFRELLAQKIDSLEKWQEVCRAAGWRWDTINRDYYDRPNTGAALHFGDMQYIGNASGLPPEQAWWMDRENLRLHLGVYPTPTDVLAKVTSSLRLGHFFPHISRDDHNMVAYTASIEDGLRDRQVRLSFGKMLRKLVPLATDTHIQRLEASHRSEMDPTFLVARTPEEIGRVYMNMAGDTGCMRYAPENWGLPNDLHPSHVYSYPGLGVAYTEVDGRIVSRSVIYDNPDDPSDKRYVRIYGDGALKRKLELAGYKLRNLQGAKIRAIDLHEVNPRKWDSGRHLVPYLDGAGGRQDERSGCYGYRIKGEDCIRLIDDRQAARLQQAGYQVGYCKETNATRVHITPIPREELEFTCEFSGQTVNIIDSKLVMVWKDGAIKRASRDAVLREYLQYSAIHYLGADDMDLDENEPTRTTVYLRVADLETATFFDSERHGARVIKTKLNRRVSGFELLHAGTYGEDNWAPRSELVQLADGWFRQKDCVMVFDEAGTGTWMHQAVLDALRVEHPKEYVQCAPNGSTKVVSHVRNPKLVTTLGKRRCIQDFHNIRQLYDGTWDYAQNVREIIVMGNRFCVSGKLAPNTLDVRLTETAVKYALRHAITDLEQYYTSESDRRTITDDLLLSALRKGIEGVHYFLKGEMLFRGHRYDGQGSLAQMRAALTKLEQMTDQQITEMLDESHVVYARAWQHNASAFVKVFDDLMARLHPGAPQMPADPERETVDQQLVVTANHIRDSRYALAA